MPAPLWLLLTLLPSHAHAQSAQNILESKCFQCHGQVQASGLDLRTPESLRKGGKRGPAVIPGDASKSLLYKAVRRDGDLHMPPGKTPLTPAEIAAIETWIDTGARYESTPSAASQTWWSFRKLQRPTPPRNTPKPIDAFHLAKLQQHNLTPAKPAGRRRLARRASFDLHGLPPSPQQIDAFLNDPSPNAYETFLDKLLDSPRYGERWGRYWLDLVRYADTSGFETDHFFTTAWRYRDYVIRSFNTGKPYHTFVQEQLAADELWPHNIDLEGTSKFPKEKEENQLRRIGTGLFTIGSFPIEYTYYGDQFRAEWQADAIDTIGAAFLGLTVSCARCHDHKFDPITQRDYYRMTALFAGSVEREIPLGSLFDIQTNTRGFPLLAQAEAWKRMARSRTRNATPEARAELLRKLGEAYLRAPDRMPTAHVLGHEESVPDTHILVRGDFKNKGEKVEPGFPAALPPGPPIREPKDQLFVPQRRKALAQWLTSPDHPLFARVMVNRIWQGHFGEGLVRTPNDFGRQGEAPTHPELLDWLAAEFIARGYSIKSMHRLIMLSDAYRMDSVATEDALARDPGNRLLTRMHRRRLDADSLRDSILATAGTLNLKMGGVGVIPPLSQEEIQAARMPNLWPAHPDPAEHNRRSIYLQMKRSLTLPILQIFDAPDSATSCARRESSTVAPQALALMNSEFAAGQSTHFAARLRKLAGEDKQAAIAAAWQLAFGRDPSATERQTASQYLSAHSLDRFALLLFNMNEFLYVD
ncbi:MAG: PSD1 domain-containing protein [Bryobacterales bacterium]|nr:PSD1 domain-containing protein [Bryobacterales bacterium]